MPVIRNQLSQSRAGGPRQFTQMREKLIIEVSDLEEAGDVVQELRNLGMSVAKMDTTPILVAKPRNRVSEVLDNFQRKVEEADISSAVERVKEAEEAGEEVMDTMESTMKATSLMLDYVSSLDRVDVANFVTTQADYGPENLRMSQEDMPTIEMEELKSQNGTLGQLNKNLSFPEAWSITKGENSIVAILDTGFSKGLISNDRIVGMYYGDSVDSVWASSEGHGTMTSGAAAANRKEGVPFNGAAPEADVILCRITDNNGQIRGDYIAEAWDYLNSRDWGKPVISNHSYGTPICSGRPKVKYCEDPLAEVISLSTSDEGHTAVYAAGNEAMTCGHRPSGLTNAVTGHNSLPEVLTVGALRFDGRGMQRYTSHGRGDCAPIADPKPNVSCRIPMKTYYGSEDGWKIKDMSTGIGGSSGGTSHASPTVAGMVALIQSAAVENQGEPLDTEEVKSIMKKHSTPPHATPVNQLGLILSERGYDARFGHGQVNIVKALNEVV